jgi:hypothetical protein
MILLFDPNMMDAQNDSFILPGRQRTIKIQDQDQDKAGQW